MTEAEVQTIKDRIDKEETWLISVSMKNGISLDDISIAMDGIKHTLDLELIDSKLQEIKGE